ncbi:MAG: aconitate hydratase AcnA [Deltaproteobacteria bacterium]|nr:aconitate hydratase AcnA [Deltaproteobacteria bacterium]
MPSVRDHARATLTLSDGAVARYYRLGALEALGWTQLSALPYAIRVLLEAALRKEDGFLVREEDVRALCAWSPEGEPVEVPFMPARVVLQDFTGVPAVVDMAALRDAMAELGGDPSRVNPLVPVDLVIDHSVQVDVSGRFADARERNLEIEYARNQERYAFLKWGQANLANFRAVPPGRGIVHQVNLEWLATVAHRGEEDGVPLLGCDTVVGTDSHTTMINGLGVLGWGVGGIEAEAVMLGQPVYMLTPAVVGFRLSGALRAGVTATDMTLRIVERLREAGVVGQFVEFFGPGMAKMSLPDRATVANMAPEYGATAGYFPVDEVTLDFLRLTGRDEGHIAEVEAYYRAQGLLYGEGAPEPRYSRLIELDLASVEPSLAGPKRPQDRVPLSRMKEAFAASLTAPRGHAGHGLSADRVGATQAVDGRDFALRHGDVVIAAVTSCTNTSNPSVMIAAGLLARNAVARGLQTKPWVKTSLAPGSRVVTDYYRAAGLDVALDALGFANVGYGCTTCIGNSGPLEPELERAVDEGGLVVASVLSGNRNFEGRVHGKVKASFLASPPLVVAYALAGTVNRDLDTEPLGYDPEGRPVYLREVWPSDEEVQAVIRQTITPAMFRGRYADVTQEPLWDAIPTARSERYPWQAASTYIRQPDFFRGMSPAPAPLQPILGARALLKLGDSVTTDHISPAGSIPPDSPAGRYLQAQGVAPRDFNSLGSRRGNHEVMVRGTFANVRLRNQLAPGTEGGVTTLLPEGEVMSVYEAAVRYQGRGTALVVLAGSQYGTGSSRDWAAKGTHLLGVRAVIAVSYERIHRSNLVGMGVLPLCFREGEDAASLGLDGREVYDIAGISDAIAPLEELEVRATRPDGSEVRFAVVARLDTPVEVVYYRNGGILQTVIRGMARGEA